MGKGETYVSYDIINMIEFHADSIIDELSASMQKKYEAEESSRGLGTKQSEFRKDKRRKPLLMFGKDEFIFKQFLLNKKARQGTYGRFSCRTKDDGHGMVVSAFQIQNLGFGCPMFEDVKKQVKKNRGGKEYKDIISAKMVNKTSEKPKLLTDPFIRVFEYVNT